MDRNSCSSVGRYRESNTQTGSRIFEEVMIMTIADSVYKLLKERTTAIQEQVKEQRKIEQWIESGKYSTEAIEKDFQPQLTAIKKQIDSESDRAIADAHNLIADYKKELRRQGAMKPEELTPDIELLKLPVTLSLEELEEVIERNSDNKTMCKIIEQYASERNIDLPYHLTRTKQEERQLAEGLEGVLVYYRNWITNEQALPLLDRFFGGVLEVDTTKE